MVNDDPAATDTENDVPEIDTEYVIPEIDKQFVDEHLQGVRKRILQAAKKSAKNDSTDGEETLWAPHIAKAIAEYAPGKPFKGEIKDVKPQKKPLFSWNVSPVTGISASLAIVFAGFGLWATLGTQNKIGGESYLDIAKIFAGAIVGSTTATAVAANKQRR